ncbi:MAG: cysteine hydrolase [Clostridia bacterium]|nr:cysteine hydrolase [Clostridia bacterium]
MKNVKTLIVVDMQKDFIDGALGTKEAVAIVENVKRKIREYYENGYQIIFTRDTHFDDYLQTNEGKHLPVMHCIKGTDGWQIAEGLEVPGAIYIDKPTFGYVNWNEFELGDVELIGLCTDICVVSNALIIKALFPENNVYVDASCCAGVTPETHNAALTTMKMCQVIVKEES